MSVRGRASADDDDTRFNLRLEDRYGSHDTLHWRLDWGYSRKDVEEMLSNGADPKTPVGPFQETPLHVAVRRRRAEIIDALLQHGADINARTSGRQTAYAHAVRRGFDEVADLLKRRGADTALSPADEMAVAVRKGDLDRARVLRQADPDMMSRWGPEDARILPDIAGYPTVEAVRFLLDAGIDISARGLDGGTALHQCGWFGSPDVAILLIERGAPLNLACEAHERSPLGWVAHGSTHSGGAAERQDVYIRMARLLLGAGALLADPIDPQSDPRGRRLLSDASKPVADVLREYGARP